ncbi:hypothetical protein BLOT_004687 [Blomia tropicalis]|nr:hypothetical protein BLOT_004687 [Blomia tropicalis]
MAVFGKQQPIESNVLKAMSDKMFSFSLFLVHCKIDADRHYRSNSEEANSEQYISHLIRSLYSYKTLQLGRAR